MEEQEGTSKIYALASLALLRPLPLLFASLLPPRECICPAYASLRSAAPQRVAISLFRPVSTSPTRASAGLSPGLRRDPLTTNDPIVPSHDPSSSTNSFAAFLTHVSSHALAKWVYVHSPILASLPTDPTPLYLETQDLSQGHPGELHRPACKHPPSLPLPLRSDTVDRSLSERTSYGCSSSNV